MYCNMKLRCCVTRLVCTIVQSVVFCNFVEYHKYIVCIQILMLYNSEFSDFASVICKCKQSDNFLFAIYIHFTYVFTVYMLSKKTQK